MGRREVPLKQTLNDVVLWVKSQGNVKSFERLRLRLLGDALEEGIFWSKVDVNTTCSPAFLAKARKVASEIVGKPCP